MRRVIGRGTLGTTFIDGIALVVTYCGGLVAGGGVCIGRFTVNEVGLYRDYYSFILVPFSYSSASIFLSILLLLFLVSFSFVTSIRSLSFLCTFSLEGYHM